jgi:20S proteasome alpha/beta subunit
MTVIAWDGTMLAADKRLCFGDLATTTTKIFKVADSLVGYSGDCDAGEEMLAWFRSGAMPEAFPPYQRQNDRWAGLLVITPDKRIKKYERTPYPLIIQDKCFAIGSGRDFALAAMHLGYSARDAVEVTCQLDSSCGNGIDVLTHD